MPGVVTLVTDEGPPANTALPTISGTAQRRPDPDRDHAAPGPARRPSPTRYQWRRCDSAGANCADIAGATASTYTLTPADVGTTIRVVVTATNAAGTATRDLGADRGRRRGRRRSTPALPDDLRHAPRRPDAHRRRPAPGPARRPITYAYQWRRCDSAGANCVDIAGATASTYTLDQRRRRQDDPRRRHRHERRRQLARRPRPRRPSSPPRRRSTPALPTITGTARDGQTLTADRRHLDRHARRSPTPTSGGAATRRRQLRRHRRRDGARPTR